MGRAIEALAPSRGHDIAVRIDNQTDWMEQIDALRQCDIAIDFSQPDVAVDNIMKCFNIGMPIVVGTTGWYDQLDDVVHDCKSRGQSLFVASNFSIGMNIMFDLNRRLAALMNRYDAYDVSICEAHHIHKLDAPSGTAITLANDIIECLDRKEEWQLAATLHPDQQPDATPAEQPVPDSAVAITSVRQGEVPGTHTVTYDSDIDTIAITHSAKSRKGLALGAILAAEYLSTHRGYHTMTDLLSE